MKRPTDCSVGRSSDYETGSDHSGVVVTVTPEKVEYARTMM